MAYNVVVNRRFFGVAAGLVCCVLLVAACSTKSNSGESGVEVVAAQEVPEGTFISGDVKGRSLVENTVIDLTLEQSRLSVYAGCNTMFGGYVFADGILRVEAPMASTQIGCPEDLSEQDQWLAGWLGVGVKISVINETSFTLDGGGVKVTFVLPQDASLVDAMWTLNSIIYGGSMDGAVAGVPLGVPPIEIAFGDDGTLVVSGECVNGSGRTSVVDGFVETIILEDVELVVDTGVGCGGETEEVSRGVVEVLSSGELSIVVDRSSLTLGVVGFAGGFNEISGLGFTSEGALGNGIGGVVIEEPWMGLGGTPPDVTGLEESRAEEILEDAGFAMRVVERDGETFIITEDYRLDRVNVVVVDEVVVDSYVG